MTEETNNQPTELDVLKSRARVMGITFSNNISVETLRKKINAKMGEDGDNDVSDAEDDNDADNDGHHDDNGTFVEGNQAAAHTEAQAPVYEAPTPAPVVAPPVQQTVAPVPTPATEPEPAPAPVVTEQVTVAPVAPAAAPPPLVDPSLGQPAPPAPPVRLTKNQEKMAFRKRLHKEQMALIRVRITNMDPKKKDLPGEIFTVANDILGTVRKYIPYGEQTDNGYHIPRWIYDQLVERRFQQIRTIRDKRTGTTRPDSRWIKEFALEVLDPLTQEEIDRLATAQAAAGSMDEFAQ